MWHNLLNSRTSLKLEKAMDYSALRGQLLSHNIANVNTPNYKRVDLNFAAILDENVNQTTLPLTKTHPRHLAGYPTGINNPPIMTEAGTTSRMDGNNVDVEYEMVKIAENSMFYQALTSSWKRQMSRLKMAIEGRV
ncbi:MAG TPA: flagellar basal body rod protein FlgB [Bacillota bacterium]|nr:flagellar basal body rod protein FlgB [Bacillota bacterium]HOL09116.1 flagellar basal body rod protein FlgB [Bacillota bacterium]HPO97173.1 flagellar basal body rod protein FlgB [Bacillota bacterium]